MDTEAFLGHVPLFSGFTRRQRRRVENLLVTRTYQPGQSIVVKGKTGLGLYIVATGKAEAVRQQAEGVQVTVDTFDPTDFFGELSLLTEGRRTATVIASEETTCLILMRADFLDLLQEDATMAVVVAQALAERFRAVLESL